MLRKILLLIIVSLGSSVPVFAKNAVKPGISVSATPLKPTETQEVAGVYISQYLLRNHFRKIAVNDSLSQEIFNRYIDNLDGSKNYFVASEVDSLRKIYGTQIDDEFLVGKSTAGFSIYNFFLKRAKEKMRFMKAVVDTAHFNFSKPETLALDNKTAPWPSDKSLLRDVWRKELKYLWLNMKYSGEKKKPIRTTLSKSFTTRLNLLNRQKPEDAFQAYNYALTTSFDPHTSYFSPDEYKNFQIDMSRSIEGIGAKLQTEGEFTVVAEIIPGGPAFKNNLLKKGDKIIGVGQGKTAAVVDVTGWRINDVVKLIRGKKGTTVSLKILPASQSGRGPSKTIHLLRDKINLEEQAAKKSIFLQNGQKIGVITIPSFYLDFEGEQLNTGNYNSTSRDVIKLLNELIAEHVQGIVIDLRENGGGSLEEAVKVTGLFIPNGPVVQISSSTGRTTVLDDEDGGVLYNGPLAVLVNRYSASASEIVAAAIQDYGRGVIIGERTFGKGTVQSIINFSRPVPGIENQPDLGEIKLTIAKFYRVSGGSTQHKGVVPDISMPSIIDTSAIGEDTYPSSLPWSTISPSVYQPTGDVSAAEIDILHQKQQDRSSKDPLYQSYLNDLGRLDQIRKKKSVSLEDSAFKTEIETMKKIEDQWIKETDTDKNAKAVKKDVLLDQSASVVSDLSLLKKGAK
ncbi:carboxy terminal-processing peptidase [Chlorobium phaeobacteroides]|uniref:C-terminal processing peptidase-1, Serine peptidase, MEROPS family S41A n=1 Tax=Chlorobium phaeobacteroides (strain DSM 266 / SMG 266 / 2430) TaxID=290317 RepID=A1BG08_CHLPD|nr:carboxy terminal-processing peptidase [Chlorobium phaeobacteroides]ABL65335.1 C-terminal processing peptidase-1, Serine peptidase, MEROPS family S41A [Chlorobium phaeobacteroides DSM 266]